MLNILIPISGPNMFDAAEFQYPKPLIEINGRPMIEHVVRCFDKIKRDKRFIFIVNKSDCRKYHIDSVLRLISENCVILPLERGTKGAACSAMMAIEHINNDSPLIISNGDHIIDHDLGEAIRQFEKNKVDAGTLCFESIHPKWSFVRLDENGKIIETAEKHPLSKHAIAGMYYFKHGSDFVKASMRMIEKGAALDGVYYIAPALNELVLDNKNLEPFTIPASSYHNFYSPHKIREYEAATAGRHGDN